MLLSLGLPPPTLFDGIHPKWLYMFPRYYRCTSPHPFFDFNFCGRDRGGGGEGVEKGAVFPVLLDYFNKSFCSLCMHDTVMQHYVHI